MGYWHNYSGAAIWSNPGGARAWYNVDISHIVGARVAVVYLEVHGTAGALMRSWPFEVTAFTISKGSDAAANKEPPAAPTSQAIMGITDSAGVIALSRVHLNDYPVSVYLMGWFEPDSSARQTIDHAVGEDMILGDITKTLPTPMPTADKGLAMLACKSGNIQALYIPTWDATPQCIQSARQLSSGCGWLDTGAADTHCVMVELDENSQYKYGNNAAVAGYYDTTLLMYQQTTYKTHTSVLVASAVTVAIGGTITLDLSSYVGAQATLVYLRVQNLNANQNGCCFYPHNHPRVWNAELVDANYYASGVASTSKLLFNDVGYVLAVTDNDGKIDITNSATSDNVIDAWLVGNMGYPLDGSPIIARVSPGTDVVLSKTWDDQVVIDIQDEGSGIQLSTLEVIMTRDGIDTSICSAGVMAIGTMVQADDTFGFGPRSIRLTIPMPIADVNAKRTSFTIECENINGEVL